MDFNKIYNIDCMDFMKTLPDGAINLVVTSPPYADQRKSTYGGVDPDEYVQWFLPFSAEIYRILADDGSFVLNIKEKVVDGERHTYVMELIIAMRKQGWKFTEEYIWHKKNSAPGKWPNRFRDAWERCIHFTKQKRFKMNQDAVRVPIGDWAGNRLKNLGDNDLFRSESATRSGIGRNMSKWVGKDTVYPTNVLHLPTECANKKHSAPYPEALPAWFIKLFSDEGDVVYDPFLGSGTTALAARNLQRRFLGTELNPKYFEVAEDRMGLKKIIIGIEEEINIQGES